MAGRESGRAWNGRHDLHVACGRKRYTLRDAIPIARAAQKTPIVDGSWLKGTLERRVIGIWTGMEDRFQSQDSAAVCAMDRFGMAGCRKPVVI